MAYTYFRKLNEKRLLQIQSRIDDIIVFDEDIPQDCKFSFVDFASTQKFIANEGIKSAKYSQIIEFANQWLIKNDFWEVVGCETIPAIMQLFINEKGEILSKQILINYLISDDIDTQTDLRCKSSGVLNFQVLLLRYWIKRVEIHSRDAKTQPNVQRIRYIDFVPKKINNSKEFEKIDEVVKRVNEKIKAEEITGKIINIQTHSCSVGQDWEFDPENTKPMNLIGKIVYILRIFYEVGPPHEEEIGLADFIPECLSGGSLLKRPKFESQTAILQRASKWLSENPEINFCSAVSIDVKLKSMTSIDSRQMASIRGTGDFIRILRIAYTKPHELPANVPLSLSLPPPPPVYLQCQTFLLLKSYSEVKRNISEFLSRDEWFAEERYKWRFLNCETVFVLSTNKRALASNLNESFQVISTSKSSINTLMFFAMKIYFDVGFYGIDKDENLKKGDNSETENVINKKESNACKIM